MSADVERVAQEARAAWTLHDDSVAWDELMEAGREAWRVVARAAIAAMQEPDCDQCDWKPTIGDSGKERHDRLEHLAPEPTRAGRRCTTCGGDDGAHLFRHWINGVVGGTEVAP